MSDTKLRDLERRWKETGTVQDEAAYLLERVRVGDLTRERLELAAYCGHEGAKTAIGGAPMAASGDTPEEIGRRLIGVGRDACVRLCVLVCESVLGAIDEVPEAALEILQLARAWLVDRVRPDSTAAWKLDRVRVGAPFVAVYRTMNQPDEYVPEWVAEGIEGGAELLGVEPDEVVASLAPRLAMWALDSSH